MIGKALDKPMEVYSTDEQVVGTWVDGKPLYRKVSLINSLSNQMVIMDLPNTTRDNIIEILGTMNEIGGNLIHLGYGFGDHSKVGIYYSSPDKKLKIAMSSPTLEKLSGQKARFICVYTKTTD